LAFGCPRAARLASFAPHSSRCDPWDGHDRGRASAILELDPAACTTLVPPIGPSLPPDEAAALDRQIAEAGRLVRWSGLALGYERSSGQAEARYVLAYTDPAVASTDAAAREALVREGRSVVDGSPLAQRFTVRSVSATGALLVIEVIPAGDWPALLMRLVVARDLLFAACG